LFIQTTELSRKNKKNVLKFLNIFLKDGSEVNYLFLSVRMQRQKDLV